MNVYGGKADLNLFSGNSYYLTESQERWVRSQKIGTSFPGFYLAILPRIQSFLLI
jgi:hypothetical protein